MKKRNILLLHGALGSAGQFDELSKKLSAEYNVIAPDFRWHGKRVEEGDGFRMQDLVADLEAFISRNAQAPYIVFGYSMGGYVALTLALEKPQYFSGIFTLGTKFAWTPEQAAHESKMLNPEKIKEKVPAFATYLEQQHANGWERLCQQTAVMMQELGKQSLLSIDNVKNIAFPVCIGLGDQDKMVTVDESKQMAEAMPKALFYVLPDTPHPLEKVNADLLTGEIKKFGNRV